MSEAQARAFLDATADQDVCVAYTHDERGVISFAAPASIVPVARLRRRPSPLGDAVKLASAASVAALLSACTPHDRGETAPVVSNPVEHAAEPMIVIPPSPATDGGPAKTEDAEPCEPSPTTTPPRAVPKKGRRKRMGVRVRPSSNDDPLG